MKKIASYLTLVLLAGMGLGSCTKKPEVARKRDGRECEARMNDVAMPVGCKLICDQIFANTVTYSTQRYSTHDLIKFYVPEMERLGWNLIGWVENTQATMVFDKPRKMCVISICNRAKKGRLVRIDTIIKPAY